MAEGKITWNATKIRTIRLTPNYIAVENFSSVNTTMRLVWRKRKRWNWPNGNGNNHRRCSSEASTSYNIKECPLSFEKKWRDNLYPCMQATGVIQPSRSPLSSPVVMACKKDGSHRFCVDYRALNSVNKADTFPLPRVDDLLDQLGESWFFSTLDFASGYWEIRVSPGSREKTAFVVPHAVKDCMNFV